MNHTTAGERVERARVAHVLRKEVDVGQGLETAADREDHDDTEGEQQQKGETLDDDAHHAVTHGRTVLVECRENREHRQKYEVSQHHEAQRTLQRQRVDEQPGGEADGCRRTPHRADHIDRANRRRRTAHLRRRRGHSGVRVDPRTTLRSGVDGVGPLENCRHPSL